MRRSGRRDMDRHNQWEEIDRLHQHLVVADAMNTGVVAGVKSHHQVGIMEGWQAAQNLCKDPGSNFQRSTRAFWHLRQALIRKLCHPAVFRCDLILFYPRLKQKISP